MPFNPLKIGMNFQAISLLHFGKNTLDDILVFNNFARRCFPSILAPVDIPCGYTINSISAVGDDYNMPIPGANFECSRYRREFSTLVGLPGSWQGL